MKDRLKIIEEKYARIKQARVCLAELQAVNPHQTFQALTLEGASGKVFISSEEPDRVYKVSIDPLTPYETGELRNLQKLARTGLAPKFFGRTISPNGHSILAMEKINNVDISQLDEAARKKIAPQVTRILETVGLYPGDVEFVFDTHNRTVKVLDVAGMINHTDISESIGARVAELFGL